MDVGSNLLLQQLFGNCLKDWVKATYKVSWPIMIYVIVDGGNSSGVREATLAWYTCGYWVGTGNHA